jgi:3-dehydroquinate synthase
MTLPYVHFSEQYIDFQSFIQPYRAQRIAVLVDENTLQYCYPKLKEYLPKHLLIEIPSGEESKHLQTCAQIWQAMTDYQMDRKTLVINLGGGVIGDMGGFCAATYKRGIDFVQIPTTLLSQVDASVGGKLGIDFQGFKNHIGVFQDPLAVWIFPDFLQTLPERELGSGFAEVIKHCLIADAKQWQKLTQILAHNPTNRPSIRALLTNLSILDLIRHSVAIKAQIVAADPTEKGLRKILNFGHTLGHAIESFYLEIPAQRLLHGEAIAIGMICEAYIAHRQGFLQVSDLQAISQLIGQIYPPIHLQPENFEAILALTYQDKKNLSGQVKFSLLAQIGEANYDQAVTENLMIESLEYYNRLVE